MFLSLLYALAFAVEPVTTVSENGTVEVRTLVSASEAEIRALLSDPMASARLAPGFMSMSTAPQGACLHLNVAVAGPLDAISYTALRCPTATGWRTSLLESDTLTAMDAEWSVTPRADGTEVVYRLRSDVSMPVPSFLVRRNVLRSAVGTLESLVRKVTRR